MGRCGARARGMGPSCFRGATSPDARSPSSTSSSQDFCTPADVEPLQRSQLGRHARSPAAAPSPLRGAAKRARQPGREGGGGAVAAASDWTPALAAPRAARRAASPPTAVNPFLSGAGAAPVVPAPLGPPPALSRYRSEYKEVATVGAGAFARVARAVHRLDGAEYAVKRSAAELFDAGDRARWQQEAAALAAAGSHPGVVRYFSSWAEPGPAGGALFYIAIELCGVSLGTKRAVHGEPLPEAELTAVAAQVADALAHLHRRGIAHMDVKPDNILTGLDGHGGGFGGGGDAGTPPRSVKLADFGLATPLASAAAFLPPDEGDSRYLAPEVLRGDVSRLDRADAFALGATLYELATGAPLPSGGATYADIREGRLRLMPAVSAGFQRVVKCLMAPDPAARPALASVRGMLAKKKSSSGSGEAVAAQQQPPAEATAGGGGARAAAGGFAPLMLRPA